ncbi:MAG: phenylacetic acid degradation protein, partial [Robiginitomaculum sp.]
CKALFATFIDIDTVDTAFICGPEPMMLTIAASLRAHGLGDKQIKYELFAGGQSGQIAQKAKVAQAKTANLTQATVTLDGTAHSFTMTKGQSMIDAAIENAVDVPFACKAGVCSTCKCKVIEGEVDMIANHALEDYEVEQGYVLSCQSYPLTDRVVLDYDGH